MRTRGYGKLLGQRLPLLLLLLAAFRLQLLEALPVSDNALGTGLWEKAHTIIKMADEKTYPAGCAIKHGVCTAGQLSHALSIIIRQMKLIMEKAWAANAGIYIRINRPYRNTQF